MLFRSAGNPRSVLFQLDRLAADVALLPVPEADAAGRAVDRLSPAAKLVLETTAMLQLADTARLAVTDEQGRRGDLEAFLGRVDALLRRCASAIETSHFTHQMPQRSLSMDSRSSVNSP